MAHLRDVALLHVAAGRIGGHGSQSGSESGGIGSDGRSECAGRESREHGHRAARGDAAVREVLSQKQGCERAAVVVEGRFPAINS